MKSVGAVLAGKLQAPRDPQERGGGSGPPASSPSWAGSVRALACFLALTVGALPVRAQEPPKTPPPADSASQLAPGRVLQVEGARGVWWPLETAQVLTQEHVQLSAVTKLSRLQAQKVTLLEEQLTLRNDSIANLKLQRDAAAQAIDGCAHREAAQALEVLKGQEKLQRARWVWSLIGAGAVVLVLGGAWVLASKL